MASPEAEVRGREEADEEVKHKPSSLFTKPTEGERPSMLFAKKESSQSTERLDDEFDDTMYSDEGENFDEFSKLLDSLNDGPSAPLDPNTVLKIPP